MKNMFFKTLLVFSVIMTLFSCNKDEACQDEKEAANNAFLALFRDYSEEGVKKYIHADLIQHNPFVPTGRDALIGFLPTFKQTDIKYTNHRIFQDGEFVVLHNAFANAQAFGAENIVTFDIYRMKDCQTVEHWDAIMPNTPPNPSGRTLTDGTTAITDLDKTAANKALATTIINTIINGTPEEVGAVVTNNFLPDYKQHSPNVGDGVQAIFAAFGVEQWVYTKNYIVLAEGNFALTISEGTAKGVPSAFYDLFRFENGKVAEHWDVIQAIPTTGLANDNGMFGGF
jgi:predicted SnoaL-like aldol condensation-catalyzing enzyme